LSDVPPHESTSAEGEAPPVDVDEVMRRLEQAEQRLLLRRVEPPPVSLSAELEAMLSESREAAERDRRALDELERRLRAAEGELEGVEPPGRLQERREAVTGDLDDAPLRVTRISPPVPEPVVAVLPVALAELAAELRAERGRLELRVREAEIEHRDRGDSLAAMQRIVATVEELQDDLARGQERVRAELGRAAEGLPAGAREDLEGELAARNVLELRLGGLVDRLERRLALPGEPAAEHRRWRPAR
jgi:hypothetical protein